MGPGAVEQLGAPEVVERLTVDPDEVGLPPGTGFLFDLQLIDDLRSLAFDGAKRDPVAVAEPESHPAIHVRVDRGVAPPHPPDDGRAPRRRFHPLPRKWLRVHRGSRVAGAGGQDYAEHGRQTAGAHQKT